MKNEEKCTCKFCGSPDGKLFKYSTAVDREFLPDNVIRYSGITEYSGGVCMACRRKGSLKMLLIGLACIIVSVLVETFIHNNITGVIFAFVLFAGIICTIRGIVPTNGSDMLIEEAKKNNPDSKLYYLQPKN